MRLRKKQAKRNKYCDHCGSDVFNVIMLQAAEKWDDDWALEIINCVSKHTDLVVLDARYHLFCQRELYKLPGRGLKKCECGHSNVDEAMETYFAYQKENSKECQFSLNQLIHQIGGEYCPDIRTVKVHLFKKFWEEIVIAETANKTCVVCFKDMGYKIFTCTWHNDKQKSSVGRKAESSKGSCWNHSWWYSCSSIWHNSVHTLQ